MPTPLLTKTCYLYQRVSTQRQVDSGVSLDNQLDTLKTYAANNGIKVIGVYTDAGVSGKNITDRHSLRSLLADIQDATKITPDYVLVFKLSRLGRNALDILSIIQTFNQYGVTLKCIADSFELSGVTGKLMCSILATVAEIERDNIREQSIACREYRAKNGEWVGGFAPYGYTVKEHKLTVVDQTVGHIQTIFKLYLDGVGYDGIAKTLNKNGIIKWHNKNCKHDLWSARYVKRIIHNPVYAGYVRYGGIIAEGTHEAIISKEVWQQVINKRTLSKNGGAHSNYLLAGLIRCPVCGHALSGMKDTHGYSYYRCRHHKYQTGQARCTFNKCIRTDRIEREVMKWVRKQSVVNNGEEDELERSKAALARLNELLVSVEEPLVIGHIEKLIRTELVKIDELNKTVQANKIKQERLGEIKKAGHNITAVDLRCIITRIDIEQHEVNGSWIKSIMSSPPTVNIVRHRPASQ